MRKPAGLTTGGLLFSGRAVAKPRPGRRTGRLDRPAGRIGMSPVAATLRQAVLHQNRNAAVARSEFQRNMSSLRLKSVPVVFGARTNGLVAGDVPRVTRTR